MRLAFDSSLLFYQDYPVHPLFVKHFILDIDVFPVQGPTELVGHWSGKIPREAWHELTSEQKSLRALASEYGASDESVRRTKKAAKRAEVV